MQLVGGFGNEAPKAFVQLLCVMQSSSVLPLRMISTRSSTNMMAAFRWAESCVYGMALLCSATIPSTPMTVINRLTNTSIMLKPDERVREMAFISTHPDSQR